MLTPLFLLLLALLGAVACHHLVEIAQSLLDGFYPRGAPSWLRVWVEVLLWVGSITTYAVFCIGVLLLLMKEGCV